MKPKYEFKGHVVCPVSAQVLGEHIDGILKENEGYITPVLLLESAHSVKSPIHECFEWNDKRAAHKHRLSQASYLLRSYIILEDNKGQEVVGTPRAIVPIKIAEGEDGVKTVYAPILRVMRDPERRAQLLQQALVDLRIWRDKYRSLTELANVFEELERLGEKFKKNK